MMRHFTNRRLVPSRRMRTYSRIYHRVLVHAARGTGTDTIIRIPILSCSSACTTPWMALPPLALLLLAISAQLPMGPASQSGAAARAGVAAAVAAAAMPTKAGLAQKPPRDASVEPWSWDTMSTFVHCSNMTGVLNDEIVALMARSSFTVLEKYQCLFCAPNQTGGEEKVLAAAKQIREVNPKAPIIFYFAVDYTRRWYDLGVEFDTKPELEVHNKDGSLAVSRQEDPPGVVGNWHVFDFAKPEAVKLWVADIVHVVKSGNLQGIFIDGYRGVGGKDSWTGGLIPNASTSERVAWYKNAWGQTGMQLKAALPPNSIMMPNGNSVTDSSPPPGYNDASIEFFTTAQIPELMGYAKKKTFVEVHAYIGTNQASYTVDYNITLAAYLVAAGENAYFGAGSTWDTCESWLVDYQLADYQKQLGKPASDALFRNNTAGDVTYTRQFASGTHVMLHMPAGSEPDRGGCKRNQPNPKLVCTSCM